MALVPAWRRSRSLASDRTSSTLKRRYLPPGRRNAVVLSTSSRSTTSRGHTHQVTHGVVLNPGSKKVPYTFWLGAGRSKGLRSLLVLCMVLSHQSHPKPPARRVPPSPRLAA